MQMDFKSKAYIIQKAKTDFGFLVPTMDITLLETSHEKPVRVNGEVKVNPFNMDKAIAIKETFSLGKLNWAIVLIATSPETPRMEAEAMSKIQAFYNSGGKKPALLSQQLASFAKVSSIYLPSCQQPVRK